MTDNVLDLNVVPNRQQTTGNRAACATKFNCCTFTAGRRTLSRDVVILMRRRLQLRGRASTPPNVASTSCQYVVPVTLLNDVRGHQEEQCKLGRLGPNRVLRRF
jgi:hypothetical protein